MNIADFIPTPDAIPVHWGWFSFFLTLTFTAHLLLMNIMVGSGIIAFFNNIRRNAIIGADGIEKDVSQSLTFIIAFTINLGVAPLLFLQVLYGQFFYVSSVLMAFFWLSVIALLIIAYYSAYYYKFKFDVIIEKRTYFIGAAVVIFLIVGFIFTNNMTMMLRPETWMRYFGKPDGMLLNLSDPTLIPRYLHFMTASVAIGGLFIAVLWSLKEKKGIPGAKENISQGMKWFTVATIVQVVIGFWFLLSQPKDIAALFMGASPVHTVIFIIGLILTIFAVIAGIYKHVVSASGITIVLVVFMVIMRDMLRTAYLEPFFKVSDLKVAAQYSPMILFLVSLIITAAVLAYVIKLQKEVN